MVADLFAEQLRVHLRDQIGVVAVATVGHAVGDAEACAAAATATEIVQLDGALLLLLIL